MFCSPAFNVLCSGAMRGVLQRKSGGHAAGKLEHGPPMTLGTRLLRARRPGASGVPVAGIAAVR